MALSGFPPPEPPAMAHTCLMISPALTPLFTAPLPQAHRKVILPSLTLASTATTLSSFSRSRSPIWRSRAPSASGTVAVSTFNSPTSWAPNRMRSVSPAASLALNFSTIWWRFLISPMTASAFSRSSPGLALSTAAAWLMRSCTSP